jgi:hypothetical protein
MSGSVRRSRCASSPQGWMRQGNKCNPIAMHEALDEEHLAPVSRAAAALMVEDAHGANNRNEENTDSGGLLPGCSVPLFREARSPPLAEFASLQSLQESRVLAPDSAPPARYPRRTSVTWVGGGIAIISLLAFSGLVLTKWRTSTSGEWKAGAPAFELASSSPSITNLAQQWSEPEPRLIVQQSHGIAGQPVPLGLTLQGPADSAVVKITGLIPGMSLSSGSAAGAGSWEVPAADLTNTWVGPPVGFVGTVELAAELHLYGARFIHRQPIRIEWIAKNPAIPTEIPRRRVREAAVTPQQRPEHDDISLQESKLVEHYSRRTHQKRVASKGTVSISRKGPAKASTRRRAPVYALPTQLTRASWPGW